MRQYQDLIGKIIIALSIVIAGALIAGAIIMGAHSIQDGLLQISSAL